MTAALLLDRPVTAAGLVAVLDDLRHTAPRGWSLLTWIRLEPLRDQVEPVVELGGGNDG